MFLTILVGNRAGFELGKQHLTKRVKTDLITTYRAYIDLSVIAEKLQSTLKDVGFTGVAK
jgi:hypothetical protein